MSPVFLTVAVLVVLIILFGYLYTHVKSLHDKVDSLIVAKVPALAPVLTGDHVVQTAQAVGQAVAQSVQAVSNAPAPHPNVTDLLFHGAEPSGTQNPTGTVNNSSSWTSFDGHYCRQNLQANKPATYTVDVGKPFRFDVSQCDGTQQGGTMQIVATSNGATVASLKQPFPSVALTLDVPVGKATVEVTYDKDSPFAATIMPGM